MRRFGGTEDFLALLERIRDRNPQAGVRSNVIVGFPGETEEDVAELSRFLEAAQLDVVGVFGYSDEDGTEAERLGGKIGDDEVAARVKHIGALVEELNAQRAEERIGERVRVLVEEADPDEPGTAVGRAAHQGPEVDGSTRLPGFLTGPGQSVGSDQSVKPGQWVDAVVIGTEGVDLIADPIGVAIPVEPAG
jgi:tRNA A37 methylthiotransferase MiaB